MQVNVLPEGRVGAPVPTAGTSGAQHTKLRAHTSAAHRTHGSRYRLMLLQELGEGGSDSGVVSDRQT